MRACWSAYRAGKASDASQRRSGWSICVPRGDGVVAWRRRGRRLEATGSSPGGDTYARGLENPSPNCLNPNGHGPGHDHAQQDDEAGEAIDWEWISHGEWLAKESFVQPEDGGGDAYRRAEKFLARLRRERGDRAVLRDIDNAKKANSGRGLYGGNLISFLAEPNVGKRRGPS
jgi:hypothetical protein